MNPLSNKPSWRLAFYLIYSLLGPVLIYTQSRGWTGDNEYVLWIGVGTVFGITAASNTPTGPRRMEEGEEEENGSLPPSSSLS